MQNEIIAMNSSTKNRVRELEKSIATLHNDIKNKDEEISLLRSTKSEYDAMLEANTLLSSEINKLKADNIYLYLYLYVARYNFSFCSSGRIDHMISKCCYTNKNVNY